MKRAVVICPGRGTYNAPDLGYIKRHHADQSKLLSIFDEERTRFGQTTITDLDTAEQFKASLHTSGDNASALIFAASYLDFCSISEAEIVAVTGNSMGWYTALSCSGVLSPNDGFHLANTMGQFMTEAMIGGQLIYPIMGSDWIPDASQKQSVLRTVADINQEPNCTLALSIDLGGKLVIAGDKKGLEAFTKAVPKIENYPMRLVNHAAFHTDLQSPVSERGHHALSHLRFNQPSLPLIDGRGQIWWHGSTDLSALFDYTLGSQVTDPYDFSAAISVAAKEFAPDFFILTGPGSTLGGSIAQSLICAGWKGMRSKEDFNSHQEVGPILSSMGRPEQRGHAVTGLPQK